MQLTKHITILFLIFLALTGLAYLLRDLFNIGICFRDSMILFTGSLIISIFITSLFFRGIKKNSQKRVMFTLSAIGLKFLLFLSLLGIYALFAERLTTEFIITFFIVYLSFSIYMLLSFIHVLKSKNI